ncbi:hypothetical protein C8R44DRAFT_863581 [Mycena epipterygia]|nr:hypothetical protein C8R44DRAFT_876666 [Mycena epipterygia]KAJ7145718.1 hypothetical protein C8R44DRAFT_863581 [Mycena epipterygia]
MATSQVQLFDTDLAVQQSNSRDLIVYSHQLWGNVEVAWPLRDGCKLQPKELVALLIEQGIYWPCFCCRIGNGSPASSQILVERQQYYVYCHSVPPRCSFFVHLNKIYDSTTLVLEYPASLLEQYPYPNLLLSYLGQPRPILPTPHRDLVYGPLQVHGYLGEYDPEFYQATCHPLFYEDLQGRLGPRHRLLPPRVQTANAGVQTAEESISTEGETLFETVYLAVGELGAMRELLGGAGLDEDDLLLLFGRCPGCDLLFLRKHLEEHQPLCYIGL